MHGYQKVALAVFSIFMTLMVVVLFTAFARKSGMTRGLDMSQIQKMRYEATYGSAEH